MLCTIAGRNNGFNHKPGQGRASCSNFSSGSSDHLGTLTVHPLTPTGRTTMPYVNIRVAGSLTKEQKEKISKGVTEVITRETNKPPESVLLFIDEVERENVAKAGKLMSSS